MNRQITLETIRREGGDTSTGHPLGPGGGRPLASPQDLSRLAGNVGHDFNNLLTVILGYGEILQDALGSQPELRAFVDAMVEAAERGTLLTERLLAASHSATAVRQQGASACEPMPAGSGAETILLVEDDASVQKMAAMALTQQGYRVLAEPTAELAIARLSDEPNSIHLVLADVQLPGMSGRELAEIVQASQPTAQVLYISGCAQEDLLAEGSIEPSVPFLHKPFTPTALANQVRRILSAPA